MGDITSPNREIERLKRRFDLYRGSHLDRANQYEPAADRLNEHNRQETKILQQKYLESRAKKASKRQPKDSSNGSDSKSSVVTQKLKRKLDSNSGIDPNGHVNDNTNPYNFDDQASPSQPKKPYTSKNGEAPPNGGMENQISVRIVQEINPSTDQKQTIQTDVTVSSTFKQGENTNFTSSGTTSTQVTTNTTSEFKQENLDVPQGHGSTSSDLEKLEDLDDIEDILKSLEKGDESLIDNFIENDDDKHALDAVFAETNSPMSSLPNDMNDLFDKQPPPPMTTQPQNVPPPPCPPNGAGPAPAPAPASFPRPQSNPPIANQTYALQAGETLKRMAAQHQTGGVPGQPDTFRPQQGGPPSASMGQDPSTPFQPPPRGYPPGPGFQQQNLTQNPTSNMYPYTHQTRAQGVPPPSQHPHQGIPAPGQSPPPTMGPRGSHPHPNYPGGMIPSYGATKPLSHFPDPMGNNNPSANSLQQLQNQVRAQFTPGAQGPGHMGQQMQINQSQQIQMSQHGNQHMQVNQSQQMQLNNHSNQQISMNQQQSFTMTGAANPMGAPGPRQQGPTNTNYASEQNAKRMMAEKLRLEREAKMREHQRMEQQRHHAAMEQHRQQEAAMEQHRQQQQAAMEQQQRQMQQQQYMNRPPPEYKGPMGSQQVQGQSNPLQTMQKMVSGTSQPPQPHPGMMQPKTEPPHPTMMQIKTEPLIPGPGQPPNMTIKSEPQMQIPGAPGTVRGGAPRTYSPITCQGYPTPNPSSSLPSYTVKAEPRSQQMYSTNQNPMMSSFQTRPQGQNNPMYTSAIMRNQKPPNVNVGPEGLNISQQRPGADWSRQMSNPGAGSQMNMPNNLVARRDSASMAQYMAQQQQSHRQVSVATNGPLGQNQIQMQQHYSQQQQQISSGHPMQNSAMLQQQQQQQQQQQSMQMHLQQQQQQHMSSISITESQSVSMATTQQQQVQQHLQQRSQQQQQQPPPQQHNSTSGNDFSLDQLLDTASSNNGLFENIQPDLLDEIFGK